MEADPDLCLHACTKEDGTMFCVPDTFVAKECEFLEDRVMTKQAIAADTILYTGQSILSYVPDGEEHTYGIQSALCKMSRTMQAWLLHEMRSLYPREEGKMLETARRHFLNPQLSVALSKDRMYINQSLFFTDEEFDAKIKGDLGLQLGVKLSYNMFTFEPHETKSVEGRRHHLFVGASRFNHMCFVPNCRYVVFQRKGSKAGNIVITASRDIAIGEECTISYSCNLPADSKERSASLGFTCTCNVCLEIVKKCLYCSKYSPGLKKCSKCHKAVYCDIDCQLKHWPTHKRSCSSSS